MSDKENQTVQLELAVLIGGGLIVPVVTALFFPAIPKNLRVPVGLGIGILVILAAILYVARILRREISGRNEDLLRTLAAGRVDETAGKMWRGSITNVTLRSATIHTLVDRLIRDVPVTRREAALYEAGREVGASWGKDFDAECSRKGLDLRADLEQALSLWAGYDANVGMGRYDFDLGPSGAGEVRVTNSFLSDQAACFPLNHWFAGYFAGTIEQLLGQQIEAILGHASTRRQRLTHFAIVASGDDG